jgi:hypothetical protein
MFCVSTILSYSKNRFKEISKKSWRKKKTDLIPANQSNLGMAHSSTETILFDLGLMSHLISSPCLKRADAFGKTPQFNSNA